MSSHGHRPGAGTSTARAPKARGIGCRQLLEKGSKMFVQVGVGALPELATGARLHQASTLPCTPFFAGWRETCSAGGPGGGRWVAWGPPLGRASGPGHARFWDETELRGVGGQARPTAQNPVVGDPVVQMRGSHFLSCPAPTRSVSSGYQCLSDLPLPRVWGPGSLACLLPASPYQFPARLIWRPWVPGPRLSREHFTNIN